MLGLAMFLTLSLPLTKFQQILESIRMMTAPQNVVLLRIQWPTVMPTCSGNWTLACCQVSPTMNSKGSLSNAKNVD